MSPSKQKVKELMQELEGLERVSGAQNYKPGQHIQVDYDFAVRGKRKREIVKEIKEKHVDALEGANRWKFKSYLK